MPSDPSAFNDGAALASLASAAGAMVSSLGPSWWSGLPAEPVASCDITVIDVVDEEAAPSSPSLSPASVSWSFDQALAEVGFILSYTLKDLGVVALAQSCRLVMSSAYVWVG